MTKKTIAILGSTRSIGRQAIDAAKHRGYKVNAMAFGSNLALGREQIILKNGARVVFVARTRNGGRGLHGDCLVFDEAQELTSEQQASFLPAISASKNPQTIYLGTPPDENCAGDAFRRIRERAIKTIFAYPKAI